MDQVYIDPLGVVGGGAFAGFDGSIGIAAGVGVAAALPVKLDLDAMVAFAGVGIPQLFVARSSFIELSGQCRDLRRVRIRR